MVFDLGASLEPPWAWMRSASEEVPGSHFLPALAGYKGQPGAGAGRSRPDVALRPFADEAGLRLLSVV